MASFTTGANLGFQTLIRQPVSQGTQTIIAIGSDVHDQLTARAAVVNRVELTPWLPGRGAYC